MRVRKMSMLALTAVAVGLSLTACDPTSDPQPRSSVSSSVSADSTDDSAEQSDSPATGAAASGSPKEKSEARCTDQTNYAGDSRSNAEINSIGEDTGTCPPVVTASP
ncbi:hypothetical protein ACFFS2_37240 [Streptomyces aurantiacus]|nr:hypothetical protein [Streptomyces aurantiacus]